MRDPEHLSVNEADGNLWLWYSSAPVNSRAPYITAQDVAVRPGERWFQH